MCICVFLCLCTGRGLATCWSPAQGVLPNVWDLVNRSETESLIFMDVGQGPDWGYRSKVILWDITPCIPSKANRRFGGTCLRLHSLRISRARNQRESRWHGAMSQKTELVITTSSRTCSRLVFWRCLVRVFAGTPAILTEIVRGFFLMSVQTNIWVIMSARPRPRLCKYFPIRYVTIRMTKPAEYLTFIW
jgi:hypothetical protein